MSKTVLEKNSPEVPCACPFSGASLPNGMCILPNPPELLPMLRELFSDEYMQKFTNFESFEAFQYSGAVIINWDRDPLIYSRELFDNFVKESTQFSTFDEMVLHAIGLRS